MNGGTPCRRRAWSGSGGRGASTGRRRPRSASRPRRRRRGRIAGRAAVLPSCEMGMGSPRRRWIVSAAALVAAACSFAPAASAGPGGTPGAGGATRAGHAPDRVIVRYRPGTDSGERADARDDVDATSARPLDLARTELVHLPAGSSVSAAVRELESAPDVEFAQPDYLYRPEAVPNDPLFGSQWNLRNTGQLIGGVNGTADADIDAPEAWDVTTGSDSVTVAVVDSGVNVDHADIAPNVYTNDEELNGTAGVDDDGNGKTDDVH